MSRLQRAYQELQEAEAPERLMPVVYPSKSGLKLMEREDCDRWISDVPGIDICSYSDGSSEGHGHSAWGFALKKDRKLISKGSGIKHGGEMLDAEIIGVRKALEAALEFTEDERSRKGGGSWQIHVFLDSQQAVSALMTGSSSTSLKDVRKFRAFSNKAEILVKRVPGHAGIQGNEEADAMAREALRELPSSHTQPGSSTLAHLRGVMNRRRQRLLDNWWEEACPPKYRQLNLQVRRRKPPELSLSRHLNQF